VFAAVAAAADAPIHCAALLGEQGGHLRDDDGEHYAVQPDRKQLHKEESLAAIAMAIHHHHLVLLCF
jgi:hypothetical protein